MTNIFFKIACTAYTCTERRHKVAVDVVNRDERRELSGKMSSQLIDVDCVTTALLAEVDFGLRLGRELAALAVTTVCCPIVFRISDEHVVVER